MTSKPGRRIRLLAPVLLGLGMCAAAWGTPPAVVCIEILFSGESPERLERAVAIPLERSLSRLKDVDGVRTSMTQGALKAEVAYASTPTPAQLSDVQAATAAASHQFLVTPNSIAVTVRAPSNP